MEIKQIFKTERYTRGDTSTRACQPIDEADWIWMPGHDKWSVQTVWACYNIQNTVEQMPVFKFRRVFTADGTPLRFDVSADERFTLLLDGEPVARGPHRGNVDHWYYQTYEISGLSAGTHTLDAICWQLGNNAPLAQLSLRGGFILKAEGSYDEQLTTGKATWQVAPLKNLAMGGKGTSGSFGVGTECTVTGTSFLNEMPEEGSWKDATSIRPPIKYSGYGVRTPGWILFPTQRPDTIYQSCTPGKIVNTDCNIASSFTVPANSSVDLWWDLGNYYCAYPEMRVSGGKGAVITWGWTESLREKDDTKGNRNEWKGKEFTHAFTDTFLCDGRKDALFTAPWWRCGKWCRITIKTTDEPLAIQKVSIGETHYPLELDASFESSDKSLNDISAICLRTLLMCMHEMMFDCPYYEQQMYPGDTRIQLNILNALTRDERMQHFVMEIFNYEQRDNGMVAMNFPTRGNQESSTYTMCWILMFKDFLMWHDNAAFLKSQMPGVRKALMGLEVFENADGLLENLPGWSFMDWVRDRFAIGVSPNGNPGEGVSALNNLLYLLALQAAASIEEALGEKHFAARWQEKADTLSQKISSIFWDEAAGMMADTTAHDCFSEHAQCLAILTDCLTPKQQERAFDGLLNAKDLAPVSTYFAYYLFEAFTKCGRADLLMERLDGWRNFLNWGASTALETQHTTARSDCHAWSACPLYFYHNAFAGISPDAPFFKHVRIAPQPAGLTHISAKTPCPQGLIETNLDFESEKVTATITLPGTLEGTFIWKGNSISLKPGTQKFTI